jgi:hypothetical protein
MSVADKMDLLPPDLQAQIKAGTAAIATFEKSCEEAKTKTEELVNAEKLLKTATNELRKATVAQSNKSGEAAQQKEVVELRKEDVKVIEEKIAALKKFKATSAAYEEAGWNKNENKEGKTYKKD